MLTSAVVVIGIIVVAAILCYALARKRDIVFNVKVPGANLHLEAKGNSRRR
ncbi:MAG: hypothetical protein AAB403_01870 [Planctomycetota bacterium]